MKLTVIIFSIFLILSGCSSDKIKLDSVRQISSPIFKGVWVSTDYIDQIQKTKSPLKSASKLLGVASMLFGGNSNSESLHVGISWNNHEGTDFTLYFKEGQKQNSLKTNLPDYDHKNNFYELAYEMTNNDTTIFLNHYTKANQLIDSKRFSKIRSYKPTDDLGGGIQFIVNSKLISGTYDVIDTLNSHSVAQFKDDGSVIGFLDYKKYVIQTDFIAGPENNLDQICFDISTKNAQCFTYQINGSTINIYEVTEDANHEFLQVGKLKYTLVRQ